ncbi:hypothetical protein ACRRTK_002348 [Alexandromys fortis]
MAAAGNQRQWKREERSLLSVQEAGEAKRLVTLAVLQKGLRVGSYSNGRSHAQLYSSISHGVDEPVEGGRIPPLGQGFTCSSLRLWPVSPQSPQQAWRTAQDGSADYIRQCGLNTAVRLQCAIHIDLNLKNLHPQVSQIGSPFNTSNVRTKSPCLHIWVAKPQQLAAKAILAAKTTEAALTQVSECNTKPSSTEAERRNSRGEKENKGKMGKKRGKHKKSKHRQLLEEPRAVSHLRKPPGYVAGVAICGERGADLGLFGCDESSPVFPPSAPVFSAPEIQCCITCKMAGSGHMLTFRD